MTYKATTRDRIAVAVANWVLNTFATREYNQLVKGLVLSGMVSQGLVFKKEQ